MNNTIVATIPFDFKGKHHTPSAKIDLDNLIESGQELTSIYSAVATQNKIGAYSYEYEVLMSSDIIFSQPEGLAKHFFDDTDFDLNRFREEYHDQKVLHRLESIAREHLQIDNLEQNPALKRALLEACKYGERLSRK